MLAMRYFQKFAIIGFIIGISAILSGILGLTTSSWIIINNNQTSHQITYALLGHCTANETIICTDIHAFRKSQHMEIIGYIILIIGLLIGILCTGLIDKTGIHFIAPIILIIGVLIMMFGCIFYIKTLAENIENSSKITLHFGYSMILMFSTCAIGCILISYFSFTAGYIYRHILSNVNIH